jgi:two-component system heavy metal sensor histidine kinase CusS
VATALATAGTAVLHVRFLQLQRQHQLDRLALAGTALAASPLPDVPSVASASLAEIPLGVICAVGESPTSARWCHPEFQSLIPFQAWPAVGQSARAVGLHGRVFLLRVEDLGPQSPGRRAHLAVEITQDEALADQILWQRVWMVVLISLATLFLSDLIFRGAMRPLKELALKAVTIRPKELGQRLNLEDFPVEIHDLVASLNFTLARMQDAFQRMEHLSTDLAHELRSPIQNIRSEIEGILLHPPPESERDEALGSALEEMDRLGAMIEQMLFLARCEDPGSELRLGPLPVPTLLQEIADYFEASAETAEVKLSVESEPLALLADRSLVQRALGNLVSNALRHTPAGGSITLRGRMSENRILLEVIDTGEGIPPDVLPRLGTRFTRVEDSRSRSKGGSGLGLAIVQGIMRLHGGTLEVESQLGQGTLTRLSFQADPTGRSKRAATQG